MTAHFARTPRPAIKHARPAAALALLIAAVGWAALCIEFVRSISRSLSDGHGWGEALFLYFRYFTNLTNLGIATLMTLTAARLVAGRAPPPARVFNAGLIYILITGATYELLLRTQWHPRGVQFFTDLVVHDVVPLLTLTFWFAFAPREGTRWRDALWTLAYPSLYFTVTLVLGAFGRDYPYNFFNIRTLGYGRVFAIGRIFIAGFYVFALASTFMSMRWARTNSGARP